MSDGQLVCSRAGCSSTATGAVEWRNPRIHDESKRKLWLACDDHVGYLRDYLAARDFPVRVIGLPEATA
ncbi:MAG: hypothetical protein JWP66_897 [Naasia sp.]|nr:hypothetical protein [Naasia sp.]